MCNFLSQHFVSTGHILNIKAEEVCLSVFFVKRLIIVICLFSDNDAWDLPFLALPGERLEHSYNSKENHVILTNYRLIVCLPETFYIVSIIITHLQFIIMNFLLVLVSENL